MTLNNANALCIEERYLTDENRQILEIAQRNGCLGVANTFIRNGRSLQEFVEWLRCEREFNGAYRRGLVGSWYSLI
jgi:hypothetical protein